MSDSAPKREVPTGLKKLLEMDIKLSKEFVEFVNKKYPIDTIRTHLKSLEVRNGFIVQILSITATDILPWNPLACAYHCWTLYDQ